MRTAARHGCGASTPGLTPLDVREAFKRLVLQALDAGRPIRLSDVAGMTFGTDDEARDEGRDEGRLIYNRARALGLSAASRVTDPATGNCELCDGGWSSGQRCQPSPRGTHDLHLSVFAQKNAYAYMLERGKRSDVSYPRPFSMFRSSDGCFRQVR